MTNSSDLPQYDDTKNALQQLAAMLEGRDIWKIVKALSIPLEQGNGYGSVEIELKGGHVDIAQGTVSFK